MAFEHFSYNLKNLYSEKLPVSVKFRNCERTLQLHVNLDLETQNCGERVMVTKLTDDNDPYFLFTNTMTSKDYEVCRITQGFLVSFDEFPSQVVRFLDLCKLGSSPQSAKYTLSLEENSDAISNDRSPLNAVLKVIEINFFKQSCHLALQLKAASDKEIIQQMSSLIKRLKENGNKYCSIVNELEEKLAESISSKESKSKEYDDLMKRYQEEKRNWKSSYCKELEKEKDQLIQMKKNLEDKFLSEKMEVEDKYKNKIKRLEEELARSKYDQETLFKKESLVEASCKQRCSKMEMLEKENASLLSDVVTLRKRNNQLDKECYDKEANLNMLITKSAVLEQEVKDKRLLVTKQQELLRLASDNKNRLEEMLNDKEIALKKKQETLKSITDELVTANQVINNLSSEIVSLKDKMKMRTNVVLEQEKILENDKQVVSKLDKEISNLKGELSLSLEQEMLLKKQVDELEEKLHLTEEKLKSNENVINFLHRKLNSQQIKTNTESSDAVLRPVSKFAALSKPISSDPSKISRQSFFTSTPYGISGSTYGTKQTDGPSSGYLSAKLPSRKSVSTVIGNDKVSRFTPNTLSAEARNV